MSNDTNDHAEAMGRHLAVDAFVAFREGKRQSSATAAAEALLNDIADSTREEALAELTAFIQELQTLHEMTG